MYKYILKDFEMNYIRKKDITYELIKYIDHKILYDNTQLALFISNTINSKYYNINRTLSIIDHNDKKFTPINNEDIVYTRNKINDTENILHDISKEYSLIIIQSHMTDNMLFIGKNLALNNFTVSQTSVKNNIHTSQEINGYRTLIDVSNIKANVVLINGCNGNRFNNNIFKDDLAIATGIHETTGRNVVSFPKLKEIYEFEASAYYFLSKIGISLGDYVYIINYNLLVNKLESNGFVLLGEPNYTFPTTIDYKTTDFKEENKLDFNKYKLFIIKYKTDKSFVRVESLTNAPLYYIQYKKEKYINVIVFSYDNSFSENIEIKIYENNLNIEEHENKLYRSLDNINNNLFRKIDVQKIKSYIYECEKIIKSMYNLKKKESYDVNVIRRLDSLLISFNDLMLKIEMNFSSQLLNIINQFPFSPLSLYENNCYFNYEVTSIKCLYCNNFLSIRNAYYIGKPIRYMTNCYNCGNTLDYGYKFNTKIKILNHNFSENIVTIQIINNNNHPISGYIIVGGQKINKYIQYETKYIQLDSNKTLITNIDFNIIKKIPSYVYTIKTGFISGYDFVYTQKDVWIKI